MTPPAAISHRAFVDAIDDGVARLMVGEQTFTLPAALLPADAREGSWVQLTLATTEPPDDDGTEELRRELGRDDPGGDIKL